MRGAIVYACEFGVPLTLALSMAMYAQSPKASDADSRLPPLPVDSRPSRTKSGSDSGGQLFQRLIPHPYVFLPVLLMGGGYYPVTYRAEAGLNIENEYLFTEIHAAYDGGRQVNDGVQPNPKGHDRYLAAAVYFLPPWLFFGRTLAGFGWRRNELSTTKYTKRADRPQFGIGYDYLHNPCTGCNRDLSMRILVNWITSGSDWQNGVHGPEISLSMPSPREKGHWFFEERLGVYRSHQTVTDRGNVPMTRSQRADRDFFSVLELGIKYRF